MVIVFKEKNISIYINKNHKKERGKDDHHKSHALSLRPNPRHAQPNSLVYQRIDSVAGAHHLFWA